MKKMLWVLLFGLSIFSTSYATNAKINFDYENHKRNKTVNFIEQGIEFTIYKNGSFDYRPVYRTNNNSVNINLKNGNTINIATNNYNNGFRVQHDRTGKVVRINNVFLHYNRKNKVVKIGNINLDYKGSHVYINNNYHHNYDRPYKRGENFNRR